YNWVAIKSSEAQKVKENLRRLPREDAACIQSGRTTLSRRRRESNMLMERQFDHGLLPSTLADERARQDFVQSLKLYLAQKVVPGIEAVYEGRVKPAFAQANGRPPRDHDEVDAVMNGNYYYRLWASLYRTAQEMMWSCVAEPILRQREDMARAAEVEN